MFGKRIVELRKQRGLTQTELARLIGISRSALSLYEIEKREPDMEMLKKIAAFFNVSSDYILGIEKSGGNNYTTAAPEFALDFKIRIKELIHEQGLTEDDFVQKTGFSKDEKDAYLHGNKMPSIENLIKIAGALDVSVDYLLNISRRKRLSSDEESLLQLFSKCDEQSKNYLIAKAGVLCVEGISAVTAGEYGKYVDEEKKSYPSNGTVGKGA